MKTYRSTVYSYRVAKQFIQDNLISMIVVRHLETMSYQISVYQSQKRVFIQSGGLNQLASHLEEITEKNIDAAMLEFSIEKGRFTLPERIA